MAEQAAQAHVADQFADALQQRTAADLGIWVFLASEILFFGALLAGYTFTRWHHPEAFDAGSRLTNIVLGSINTAVLLTSSLTMALGVRAAKLGARRALAAALSATVVLGLAFIAIKFTEYYLDFSEHLVPGIDFSYPGSRAPEVALFFWLYFIMTGVHLVHLLAGVCVVATILAMALRGAFSPAYFTPVEVAGLYWHLVDIVWIFLYPLLYLVARS